MTQHISKEQREAILEKAFNRKDRKLKEIAQENGVSLPTLYVWMRNCGINTPTMEQAQERMPKKTAKDKLAIICKYFSLPDEAKGDFLRKQGLYLSQVEQWIQKPITLHEETLVPATQLYALKKEKDLLDKELTRKTAALAEAAALIVLKKKALHLFGLPTQEE